MIYFRGDGFAQSTLLRSAYEPFLERRNVACAYLSLCTTDEHLSFDELKQQGKNVFIGTTQLCCLPDERLVINHAGYRCVTASDLSCVKVNREMLRGMTEKGYRYFNEALYQLARFRALYMDMLVLHASAIVYRDEVILFSGMKGAGKSTQARLWLENTDAWALNYDKPVVQLPGERVLASGSPWGGKEDLAINEVRPVRALFFVHQAKENRVVRLSAAQAYAQAHLNYFVYPLNEDMENRYNEAVIQLVRKVPVYDLHCTDTPAAVEAVKRALYPEEE